MFYALATGKLETGAYRFVHALEDIESLNQKALRGEYEVTAVSIHAYAFIADKYALLSSGASMGDRYGPMVVARTAWPRSELADKLIAVPGTMTTAFLALNLLQRGFRHIVVSFDKIMDDVKRCEADGGLMIHEWKWTYAQAIQHKIYELGSW